jgi:hypothetical protein
MGFIKDLFIQGIHYIEKSVCDECFDDYAIKEFIKENASIKECDYCGKSSKESEIATSLHEIVEFMLEGIRYEWDEPGNCVGWEGGWVGAEVIDKYDLILEQLELEIENQQLFDDIVRSINIPEWCQRDPYNLPPGEEMFYNWEKFTEQVKHQIRYVFFRTRAEPRDLYDRRQPYAILNEIGNVINDLDLIKTLPADTEFMRVRIDNKRIKCKVNKLGPPPKHKAIYSNRMSPAGISMFYASTDEKTAIAETYNKKDKLKKYATIATFKTIKPFNILELTHLPDFPSLFDRDKRHLRAPLIFLRSFLRDFSKPIIKDGREHIEYVPTQIVTEYFRHIFRDEGGNIIKGIIYPSSRRRNGKSCVLFFENKNCTQDNIASNIDDDKWLMMISSSVKMSKLK